MTEVILSSLLVGGVVAGALSMTGLSVRSQSISSELAKGPFLADTLLSEIMGMPYHDPDNGSSLNTTNPGEPGGTRLPFDDVGDFNGWSSSALQDWMANPLVGYEGWSRAATVQWADPATGNVSLSETGLKRILVTVTSPTGIVTTRFGIRFDGGALEKVDTSDPTIFRLLSTTLTLGSPAVTVSGMTNLLNPIGGP
jgi:hypothetical protein